MLQPGSERHNKREKLAALLLCYLGLMLHAQAPELVSSILPHSIRIQSSGTEIEKTDTQRVGRSRRELGEKSARKLDSVLLKDGRYTDPKMILWAELDLQPAERLQPLPWKVPPQF